MSGVIDLDRAIGRNYAEGVERPKIKKPGCYLPADYIAHIRYAGGIAAAAARNMGVTRSSVSNMAARHPEVRDAIEEERGQLGDLLEQRLFRKATGTISNPDGDTQVQIFLLTTKFRDRGYARHYDINLTDDIKDPFFMTAEELLEAEQLLMAAL